MKLPVLLVPIAFALLHSTVAQREESLQVVDELRKVHPAYRDLQNFVVTLVQRAKQNTSEAIFNLQTKVVDLKEQYVKLAISLEEEMRFHIDGQAPTVADNCLDYLRQNLLNDIHLSGIDFSNCILDADSLLHAKIAEFYQELDGDSVFVNTSIYEVFKGQNIFSNPQTIITKLQEKHDEFINLPYDLEEVYNLLVDQFSAELDDVRRQYKQCLILDNELLVTAVFTLKSQLTIVCRGELLPIAPEIYTVDPLVDLQEDGQILP